MASTSSCRNLTSFSASHRQTFNSLFGFISANEEQLAGVVSKMRIKDEKSGGWTGGKICWNVAL